jgi:hypothetical protein
VAGEKVKLVFGQQPASNLAGSAISPAVSVQIVDLNGNVVTSDNSSIVTLAIGSNPGNGTLSGDLSGVVTRGVITFPGLSIDKTGNDYTLTAASANLPSAISAVFNVINYGDANLDGTLNMADVTWLERTILQMDPPSCGCDANNDGEINMGDVTKIERFILKLEPQ